MVYHGFAFVGKANTVCSHQVLVYFAMGIVHHLVAKPINEGNDTIKVRPDAPLMCVKISSR